MDTTSRGVEWSPDMASEGQFGITDRCLHGEVSVKVSGCWNQLDQEEHMNVLEARAASTVQVENQCSYPSRWST